MNIITGVIEKIDEYQSICQIKVNSNGIIFNVISLRLPKGLYESSNVNLIFKEAEVIIAKDFACFIGVENLIPVKVDHIKIGEIFCEITLLSECGEIKSLITSNSFKKIKLYKGERVYLLIKANEIGIGVVNEY